MSPAKLLMCLVDAVVMICVVSKRICINLLRGFDRQSFFVDDKDTLTCIINYRTETVKLTGVNVMG